MKLLQSSRVPIPMIYLLEDEKEIRSLPMGIPFIRGNIRDYENYVILIEFEVLLKAALASKLPFKWHELLKKKGFDTSKYIRAVANSTFHLSADNYYKNLKEDKLKEPEKFYEKCIVEHIRDIDYQVDIEYLKNLKIIPTWFSKDIENAVKENILNTIVYNPGLYNKKLDMCSGSIDLNTPEKNLIIIDVSGSIPTSISEAVLLLSKTMSTQFYADLLITGSISTLYDYTSVDSLDLKEVYSTNGRDNDQRYFKRLLSSDYRKYDTVIVFGDNHSPSMAWNKGTEEIPIKDGKELCKWEVKKILSFHTTENDKLAGYADWFNTNNVTCMKNWVHTLRNN